MFMLAGITSTYRSKLISNSFNEWLKPNSKVLDLGCGNGIVSKCLADEYNLKLTGCDIMNYLAVDIPFVKMKSIYKLPFKDKSFDFVIVNDVLHHTSFGNQEKLIKEALRISKSVLIFEVQPTLSGKIFDFILNKIHNSEMDIPFTFRDSQKWFLVFDKLKIKYHSKRVSRPVFYPFQHIAFKLNNK